MIALMLISFERNKKMGNISFQPLKQAIKKRRKLLIVVHGGPCSGRTTQCKMLAEKLHLAHITPEVLIRNCLEQEDIKKPEARLQRLRRKRMYTYNAIKTHEKMTKDEKLFLEKHHEKFLHSANSVESKKQLYILREDSDSEEEQEIPSLIKSLRNSLKKGHPIDPIIITILIKESMEAHRKHLGCNGFLIDGYPRDSSQAEKFIQMIGEPHVLLYLECPFDVLKERIVKRAAQTQRYDDNDFTIPCKFQMFQKYTEPLIQEWQAKLSSSNHVNSNQDIQKVHEECVKIIEKVVGAKFKKILANITKQVRNKLNKK